MNKKSALGRGLDAIFEQEQNSEEAQNGLVELRINDIEPDLNQPRKNFDLEKLRTLADSIKEQGLIQPILVRKDKEIYRIIAGERRWRASKLAGMATISAIVRDYADEKIIETALIENLQRQDLNPIEEAMAFDRLITDYNMTQEKVAGLAGKSRPAVSNLIRLLSLSDEMKKYLISGQLTEGHARAILGVQNESDKLKLAGSVIKREMSVRDTERLVNQYNNAKKTDVKVVVDENIAYIEERLKKILSTKVKIINTKRKGKIVIEYYSNDELERIITLIGKNSNK